QLYRPLIFYFEVIKNNLHPQSFTYVVCHGSKFYFYTRSSNHIFVSYSSNLLDFLPETYNIRKWIFYPQLILHSTPKVLHPNFPVSLTRSSTYFLWEIKISCLKYATSIPRKYFSFPNSFISNCVFNFSFKVSFSISSS
ncbi:hypothetical protein CR513_06348, partial [Mucuna pruriens]